MTGVNFGRCGFAVGLLALGIAWGQTAEKPKAKPPKPKPEELFKSTSLVGSHNPATLPATVSVHFQRTPLNQAVAKLGKDWNVNFQLSETGLSNAMVEPDVPINVDLENVPAEKALHAILAPLDLGFCNAENVVEITDRESMFARRSIRSYPVVDLMVGNRRGEFVDHSQTLIALLELTVDRDVWELNGGDATMDFDKLTLTLVVDCPITTHDRLEKVLRGLRLQSKRTDELLLQLGMPPSNELRSRLVLHGLTEPARQQLAATAIPATPAPVSSEAADRALKEATEARQVAEKALRLALKLEAEMQAKKK